MQKARRFIRKRVSDSDSDSNANNSTEVNKAVSSDVQLGINDKASILKKQLPKVTTTSSILSFDIEEDESFQIKKSSFNKKAVKQLKKNQKQVKTENNELILNKNKKSFVIEKNQNEVEEDCFEEVAEDNDVHTFHKNTKPNHYSDLLKTGGIPDANLIYMLKQKRQQAKGEDFISIKNTSTFSKSRLIREDDNDASDDEGSSNMMSSVSHKQKDLERRRIQESILMAQDESESEKEQGWEEVQMKKAMSDNQFFSDSKNLFDAPTNTPFNNLSNKMNGHERKSLSQKLLNLEEQHEKNKKDREEVKCRIQTSLDDSERLSGDKGALDHKYNFYQKMHAFVLDYVDCMNEKMNSIAYLERCVTELHTQRADKVVQRRQQDVKEQASECFQAKTSVLPGQEEEMKKRSKAERESRRARRRRARVGQTMHREGWSSDDELTHSEHNKFKNDKERLAEGCRTCLDDVLDQFHSIPLILARFSAWKSLYQHSYSDAYIGLCLCRLFTPIIKLQLITWNPLEESCNNFEKSPWFRDLLDYGDLEIENTKKYTTNNKNNNNNNSNNNINNNSKEVNEDGMDKIAEDEVLDGDDMTQTDTNDDPDVKLLPNVIDKILVNKITGVVDHIWDPMSNHQSNNLRRVVAQVMAEYSLFLTDSKNLQSLIGAINKRLVRSIESDLFIPLYTRASIEERNSPASIFFHRQLHAGLKLFCNTLVWQGVLSDRLLQTLVLDRILNRYLVIAIQSAPLTAEIISVCQCIASSIPQEWFAEYVEGVCIPQLEQISRVIVSVAQKELTSSSTESRSQVKQLAGVLSLMHSEAQALQLHNLL